MQKTRPAVIVSNNASNRTLNRVQVVPITSRTDRVYPCEAIVNLNGDPRKAWQTRSQRLASFASVPEWESCLNPTCGLPMARFEFNSDSTTPANSRQKSLLALSQEPGMRCLAGQGRRVQHGERSGAIDSE
jgi:hypothetical protein